MTSVQGCGLWVTHICCNYVRSLGANRQLTCVASMVRTGKFGCFNGKVVVIDMI